MFAFEVLNGLPREKVLGAIEPVLRAHGLAGVELIWRTDHRGRVLEVTLERVPSVEATVSDAEMSEEPRATSVDAPSQAGVTLDECSRVSRDLSTALDVAQAIDRNYRLEVGTPGLDRKLYVEADYRRFTGRRVQLKLSEPLASQHSIEAELLGVDDEGCVLVCVDGERHALPIRQVRAARLCVDWASLGLGAAAAKPSSRRSGQRGAERG